MYPSVISLRATFVYRYIKFIVTLSDSGILLGSLSSLAGDDEAC